jgi:hypothetical protein
MTRVSFTCLCSWSRVGSRGRPLWFPINAEGPGLSVQTGLIVTKVACVCRECVTVDG